MGGKKRTMSDQAEELILAKISANLVTPGTPLKDVIDTVQDITIGQWAHQYMLKMCSLTKHTAKRKKI